MFGFNKKKKDDISDTPVDPANEVIVKKKRKKLKWDDKTAEQKIETFVSVMEKAILSYPNLMKRSFIAGVFTGLGATIGVTLIFLILAAIIRWLGYIPFIGDYVKNSGVDTFIPGNKK